MNAIFSARAWALLADRFAKVWNAATSFEEAASALRGVASGPMPRWALMARAAELRKAGFDLRLRDPNTARVSVSSVGA